MVELICVIWFIVELLLRFISCPSKRSFCRDIMNVFDVLAIVPFFVTLATMQVHCPVIVINGGDGDFLGVSEHTLT